MNESKRRKLEEKGWKVGTLNEFLELSQEETAYIEMKAALSRELREFRRSSNLTQAQLAQMLRSSQSRVAKMEAGDPSVSIDLLIRALLAVGAERKQIASMFL